jgi:hypothetical protein
MIIVTTNEESGCAKLLGLTGNTRSEGGLISSTTSLLDTPAGEGFDLCTFYFGPSDNTIFNFGENSECGNYVASADGEPCGSIAFSSGGSFSCGGGCDYAC